MTMLERKRLIKKLGCKCVYCDCKHEFLLTIDHKKSLGDGGKDAEDNYQVTCHLCNSLKSDMKDGQFKIYLKQMYNMYQLNKIKVKLSTPKIEMHAYNEVDPPLPPIVEKINEKIIKDKEVKKV